MLALLGSQFSKALAAAEVAPADPGAERILDAALAQFLDVGLKRSSMEDVAKRAGLSRVTLYRRFPQKERLAEAVLLRECQRLIRDTRALMQAIPDIEERIETAFVHLMRAIHSHPLATRLLRLEPELVLPFLTVKAGPVIAIGTAFIAEQIRIAQKSGDFAAYDARPVAEIVARLAHSLLLTPEGGIPLMTDAQARAFARAHVVPFLVHGADRGRGSTAAPRARKRK